MTAVQVKRSYTRRYGTTDAKPEPVVAPYQPPDQSHWPSQDHGDIPMTDSVGLRFSLKP